MKINTLLNMAKQLAMRLRAAIAKAQGRLCPRCEGRGKHLDIYRYDICSVCSGTGRITL